MVLRLVFLLVLTAGWFTPVAEAEVMQAIHPADEEPGDPRFSDVKEILRMALEKTVAEFGPYRLRASTQHTNGLRYLSNLARESDLNVVWSSTTVEKSATIFADSYSLAQRGLWVIDSCWIHKDLQARFAASS